MLLSFDVEGDAIEEHDRWHTHEHLPERLSIPGFRRGTRWTATEGGPRYLVLYEVESLATLTSEAYLARLNNPTPWTTRMMPHYRGMNRGLCVVLGSFGFGQGGAAALIRFSSEASHSAPLNRWLLEQVGPLQVAFELGSAEAIKRVVAAGEALGCLSREAVARELTQGTLVELATRLPRATRRLAIVLHRDKRLGRGTEAFVRHCEQVTVARRAG